MRTSVSGIGNPTLLLPDSGLGRAFPQTQLALGADQCNDQTGPNMTIRRVILMTRPPLRPPS